MVCFYNTDNVYAQHDLRVSGPVDFRILFASFVSTRALKAFARKFHPRRSIRKDEEPCPNVDTSPARESKIYDNNHFCRLIPTVMYVWQCFTAAIMYKKQLDDMCSTCRCFSPSNAPLRQRFDTQLSYSLDV